MQITRYFRYQKIKIFHNFALRKKKIADKVLPQRVSIMILSFHFFFKWMSRFQPSPYGSGVVFSSLLYQWFFFGRKEVKKKVRQKLPLGLRGWVLKGIFKLNLRNFIIVDCFRSGILFLNHKPTWIY